MLLVTDEAAVGAGAASTIAVYVEKLQHVQEKWRQRSKMKSSPPTKELDVMSCAAFHHCFHIYSV